MNTEVNKKANSSNEIYALLPVVSETKTCGTCGKNLPKTIEYFYTRKIKNINKNGELKIYNSFRSDCKKCKADKETKKRIEKRCKILGCEVSEYKETYIKQKALQMTKDLQAKNQLTPIQYMLYLRKLKNGIVKNVDDYLKSVIDNKKLRNKRIVNEVYSRQKYFTKEDLKKAKRNYQKNNIKNLTNATIANLYLGFKIDEVPIEVIETKRLLIQLKRELKINS